MGTVPGPIPGCCREWEILVDPPTFSDAEHAVAPITLRHDSHSVVAFDLTADGGGTWDLDSSRVASARKKRGERFPSPRCREHREHREHRDANSLVVIVDANAPATVIARVNSMRWCARVRVADPCSS
jgi:hypothetical protein